MSTEGVSSKETGVSNISDPSKDGFVLPESCNLHIKLA
jgi:hypothetical protein